jgi:hypothetical protein
LSSGRSCISRQPIGRDLGIVPAAFSVNVFDIPATG